MDSQSPGPAAMLGGKALATPCVTVVSTDAATWWVLFPRWPTMSLHHAGRRVRRRVAKIANKASVASRRAAVAARLPPPPYAGSILDALDAAGLVGPSWAAWRVGA